MMSQQPLEKSTAVVDSYGPCRVHLVRPRNWSPQKGCVVVVQEAFGVNDHILSLCERFASQGYLAAAPELFHALGAGVVFGYHEFDKLKPFYSQLKNEHLLADIKATLEYLNGLGREFGAEPPAVGVVGFCMGGFTALLAACHLDLKAVVSFYGAGVVRQRPSVGIAPYVKDLGHLRCPALLFYGGQDASIPPEDREAISEALAQQKQPYEVKYFENAQHGFFCDARPSYHADAAREAWEQTLAFLKQWMLQVK